MVYIYADILFLLNFCMDFAVMKTAARFTRKAAKTYRIALGAALASLVYCVFFCLGIGSVPLTGLSFAGVLLGLAVGFCPMRASQFALLSLCTGLLTFVLGGLCMAVYYNFLAPNDFPSWLLALTALGGYAAVKLAVKNVKRGALSEAKIVEAAVCLMGKEASCQALVDTGHDVREPISRRPVIVAEFDAIRAILPENTAGYFMSGKSDLELAAKAFEMDALAARLRVIPFRSIGETAGSLAGFRPDYCVIGGVKTEKAVVAVYNQTLSADGGYQALVNPEMLRS